MRRCSICALAPTRWSTVDGEVCCWECALHRDLDRLLPPDGPAALAGLRAHALAADPLTTRRWLLRQADLLGRLGWGLLPLTHDAFDELPPSRAVEHLRVLLVETGALPAQTGRGLDRLERDLPGVLQDVTDATARRVVEAWFRWSVLPRLRRQVEHGVEASHALANTRRGLRQVVAFLHALDQAGHALTACPQAAIDDWFTAPGAARHSARPFLAWAQQHRQLPAELTLPPAYRGQPVQPADPEHRWAVARMLVTGDDLDPADRVAGALVVLFAQTCARIVRLTVDDVDATTAAVTVRLGRDPLDLPGPFAALITQLPLRRRRGVAEQSPTRWLFPGGGAGRHLDAGALSRRLRAIGIDPRPMRLAAISQLAREVPPAMLISVLGVTASTATRWTTTSGGAWATYATTHRG